MLSYLMSESTRLELALVSSRRDIQTIYNFGKIKIKLFIFIKKTDIEMEEE
jgi:hypothetical protein